MTTERETRQRRGSGSTKAPAELSGKSRVYALCPACVRAAHLVFLSCCVPYCFCHRLPVNIESKTVKLTS